MGYKVYLIDSINYVELDTENIDITTIFSVSDVNDLAVRKDNITKHITFKGTKVNNNAFGSMFHLNRTTSTAITGKLFFNFNSLRAVDCIIMEDNIVIYKGSMRVTKCQLGKWYETVVTGRFTDFTFAIQNKFLTDIDLSDLRHRYHIDTIKNSWATSVEKTNSIGSLTTEPFSVGNGYVYPYIDYGVNFQDKYSNWYSTIHNANNFRPAVYVKEIIARIVEEAGYTYEVKGDADFINRFNSLVVPNADEKLSYKLNGFYEKFAKNPGTTINKSGITNSGGLWGYQLIPLSVFTPPPTGTIPAYITHWNGNANVFYVERGVSTDGYASVTFSTLSNPTSATVKVGVNLIERDFENNVDPTPPNASVGETRWNRGIAYSEVTLNPFETLTNKTLTLAFAERKFTETNQLGLRINVTSNTFAGRNSLWYAVSDAELRFPKDNISTINADVKINNGTTSDYLVPKLPDNIKQIDFIKSLMNLFNMYVYTSKEDTKKIIFEKYDDYYALCSPDVIASTALNWSNKISYSSSPILIPNLQIPKKYLFTYKDDSDYINADYKKKYGEVYGTFRSTDAFGVTDEKKVELIFSPTPITTYNDTGRAFPALFTGSLTEKKSSKTNIRVLYYNGLKACSTYTINKDKYNTSSSAWETEVISTETSFPMISNFYYEGSTVKDDLHFGRSKEFYFNVTTDMLNADYAYGKYYINQVTELTNPNVFIVECDATLNELDISNLDLKTPIYIDMGEFGHSYFKILSIEYIKNSLLSKIVLQKIVLGTDR